MSWTFTEEPNLNDLQELLTSIPAWTGSEKTLFDYRDYIVAIPQWNKKESRHDYKLYMMVPGKARILRDAHIKEDGSLYSLEEDVEVEWRTDAVVVKGYMISEKYGKVFEVGTGNIGSGAKGADSTNPLENAMTSWRGRAASCLCNAGVLPTGIASAEEVVDAMVRSGVKTKEYTTEEVKQEIKKVEKEDPFSDDAPPTEVEAKPLNGGTTDNSRIVSSLQAAYKDKFERFAKAAIQNTLGVVVDGDVKAEMSTLTTQEIAKISGEMSKLKKAEDQ